MVKDICYFSVYYLLIPPHMLLFVVVLMERKDSLAVNFVKQRKEKFKKMEECWAKARERKMSNARS